MLSFKDITLGGDPIAVAAEVTDEPVSREIDLSALDRLNGVLNVVVADSVLTNAITLTFQDSFDGETWTTVKTVDVTTDNTYVFRWNVQDDADLTFLPLRNRFRVAVTTGEGDTLTVESVQISSAS